jgi:hypothetical protein
MIERANSADDGCISAGGVFVGDADLRAQLATVTKERDELSQMRVPMVRRATGRTIPDLTKREHVCEYQGAINAAQHRRDEYMGDASTLVYGAGGLKDLRAKLSAMTRERDELRAGKLVADERHRQIAKGYDAAHDDAHTKGEIAHAVEDALHDYNWPNHPPRSLWVRREHDPIRSLIIFAAMLVAEAERLERAALAAKGGGK